MANHGNPGAVEKAPCNIVWLKRDLRLRDHHPLWLAQQTEGPILLLYLIEDILLDDPHMDIRHWRFIWQSLQDMQDQLQPFGTQIILLKGEAIACFERLREQFGEFRLFSYQEVGLGHTFARDKQLQTWCDESGVSWQECPAGAVIRGLGNREPWDKHWQQVMRQGTFDVELQTLNWLKPEDTDELNLNNLEFKAPQTWLETPTNFQLGGEKRAWYTLHHFFKERGKDYAWSISKPEASRKACSRLSPYLAWGNISLKQVYQTSLQHWNRKGWRRALVAFVSRLHWHCHFIQKFESECEMEFRPVNRAYLQLEYDGSELSEQHLIAWQQGHTGVPLVDACMRCLAATGYINFRMRAMLVSFLVHHLEIDWRRGVQHLARMFLDFEPGIHYPQFQMQAGVTGANMIRIYNPVKQAQEHDSDGAFIKKWCPELAQLPAEILAAPWLISPLEQQMYEFTLGIDYPEPIVDVEKSYRRAQEKLWSFRKRDDVKSEARRILAMHTVPSTRHKYQRGPQ